VSSFSLLFLSQPIGSPTCVAGQYFDGTTCALCKPGFYQCSAGQVTCDPCHEGTYNPNSGSTSPSACIPCPRNTYNDLTGQGSLASCTPCPLTNPYSNAGAVTIEDCYNPTLDACLVTPNADCIDPVSTFRYGYFTPSGCYHYCEQTWGATQPVYFSIYLGVYGDFCICYAPKCNQGSFTTADATYYICPGKLKAEN